MAEGFVNNSNPLSGILKLTYMTIKNLKYLIFYSIILTIFSCQKEASIFSAGEIAKELRYLDAFNAIELYDCFDVYLKSDTINKIEIEAGKKQFQNIETSVLNGVLTITDSNKMQFLKGYDKLKLYISVDSLTSVNVYDASKLLTNDTLNVADLNILFVSQLGSCNITINARSLGLDIWYGAGDYILKGKTNHARLNACELSFIYADALETNSVYVLNNGMGDCYVKSNGSLGVEINDSGNIYYSGNPVDLQITSHSGNGKLIKK